MATQQDYNKAMELVKRAMDHQMAGELDDSIRLYKQSIALCPTADAYTYLGWAYSFQGRVDEAIAQCEIAIQIDPEFGNPYNDIGVYLMQQEKLDEAIPWLEKAKTGQALPAAPLSLYQSGSGLPYPRNDSKSLGRVSRCPTTKSR